MFQRPVMTIVLVATFTLGKAGAQEPFELALTEAAGVPVSGLRAADQALTNHLIFGGSPSTNGAVTAAFMETALLSNRFTNGQQAVQHFESALNRYKSIPDPDAYVRVMKGLLSTGTTIGVA